MAGIFANIDSDIDKLRKLKTEIEGVKKALTSINVKVDIDIANGLEAQLKNLTMQYDALARKVSEAEGKIMVSTQRINQAAEKIVKAQEQIMKTPEGQPQPVIKNDGNTSANKTETASIEAQAKAYDELAAEIDAVMGSRSQNIKRMVEEQNAIRLINEELKRMEKLNSTGTFSANEIKRIEQLNGSLLKHKTALSELRQSLNNSFKLDNSAATSMNALSQSLGRMRMAYRELTEEERKSPFGQELLASIQQADAKIKQLDATIGNYQRNVGNYASGFNGLNMSVQQIVRELPSATMGLNMFFLAISNNLPILTDEIKRAKAANEELKKSGKSGVPVWKQLVSSLFSWQSALMVGITVLTMYGDEIIDWVKGLFGAKDPLDKFKDSIMEVNGEIALETKRLNALSSKLANAQKGSEDWYKIKNTIVSQYGKYLDGLDREISSVGNLSKAYDKLVESMRRSMAMKKLKELADKQNTETFKLIADNYVEIAENLKRNKGLGLEDFDIYMKWIREFVETGEWKSFKDAQSKGILDQKGYDHMVEMVRSRGGAAVYEARRNYLKNEQYLRAVASALGSSEQDYDNLMLGISPDNKKKLEDVVSEIHSIEAEIRKLRNEPIVNVSQIEEYQKRLLELKSAYSTMTGTNYDKTNNNVTTQADAQLEAERKAGEMLVELRRENDQAYIDAMQDGTQKKLAQIVHDYMEQKAEVDRQEAELRELNKKSGEKNVGDDGLTNEQRAELNQKRANIEENTDKAIEEAYDSEFAAEEKAMNEYLKKYGDYQQKRQAIAEEYAQKIAAATNEWDKKLLEKERDSALKGLDEQYKGTTKAMADLFEDASEKSVSSIQKIIDKYELLVQYLSGTKKGDNTTVTMDELKTVGFTDDDIEKIKNGEISIKDLTDAIKKLKDELKGKSPWQSFISDMENAIEKLKSAAGDMSKIGEGITGIGNAVTAFAPALGEFGANIASIFGAEDTNITEIANAIGGLGQTAAGVGQIMAGDIVGGVMSAVGGISSIVGAFKAIHDKKNEERIQDLQDRIDALGNSYDRLGKEIEKSYSTDTAKLYGEQNEVLEQQKKLIEQQIAEEEDKKDTDDDRIKQWKEELQDINDQIEENKEAALDAITGTDVMSAIDDFAQAYADAWASGTSAAKASTDVVKSLIKTSLLQFLKNQLSPTVEEFMGKLAEYMADGIIDPWEQAQLDKLKEEMDKTASEYYDNTSSYWDDSQQEQQSATRGFSTEMTQDQASELSGRFTAVAESNLRIEGRLTEVTGHLAIMSADVVGVRDIANDMRDIIANSYIELQQISENTGEIIKPIKQMQLDIAEVKRNTSRL